MDLTSTGTQNCSNLLNSIYFIFMINSCQTSSNYIGLTKLYCFHQKFATKHYFTFSFIWPHAHIYHLKILFHSKEYMILLGKNLLIIINHKSTVYTGIWNTYFWSEDPGIDILRVKSSARSRHSSAGYTQNPASLGRTQLLSPQVGTVTPIYTDIARYILWIDIQSKHDSLKIHVLQVCNWY